MDEKLIPLFDRVLIKRAGNEQTSAGGIIIPDTAQEKTQIGIVQAVGEGKVNNDGSVRQLKVKKGNKVLFGKYSGTEITLGKDECLILKEDEILGIFV